MEEVMKNLKE